MILLYWSTNRRLTPKERLGQAESAPVVALTCADSVSLLVSAKAGSVLRPDALVPSPVSWTMAGPMTYRAAMPGADGGSAAGTDSRAAGRTRADGSIRAGAYGNIRSRTDRGSRTRTNA